MQIFMGVPTPIASIVAFPEFAEDNLVDGSFYRRILVNFINILSHVRT